jgi:tol-pal system protein YbgF
MTMRSPTGAARAGLVLAALLYGSGCATKGDLRSVSNEIRLLQARQDSVLAELRYQSSVTQDTLRTTTRDLLNMRGEIMRRLTQLQEDVDELSALTGEIQRANASIRDQLVTRGGRMPDLGGPPAGGGGVSGGTGEADALYNAAVDQLDRNQIGTARQAFTDFLSQYPNDELAPRAHYYLAEIHLQENRQREAIREFLVIRERFPEDDKVADALYRVGLVHAELGERNEARRYLETVVNTYPDNPVTPLARQALRDLGGRTP